MNTRLLLLTSVFLTLVSSLESQTVQTAGKTFYKAFYADGNTALKLELPGIVDIKEWDNPVVRVEINVVLPAGKAAMLNELASVGRYNLSNQAENGVMSIQATNLQKQLRVKGEELKEIVSFVVYVPAGMKVDMLPSSTPILAEADKK